MRKQIGVCDFISVLMGNTKKTTLKLMIQSLIVFGVIAAILYFMGLLETFGIIGFFITVFIATLVIVFIFL